MGTMTLTELRSLYTALLPKLDSRFPKTRHQTALHLCEVLKTANILSSVIAQANDDEDAGYDSMDECAD